MGTYYGGYNAINDLSDLNLSDLSKIRLPLPSYINATTLPFNSIAIDKRDMKKLEIPGDTDGDSKMIKETKDKKEREYVSLDIRRIIKNGPATIVFWEDNTKTVVVRKKGEKDNMYYAFCAALAKRIYGNNSQVNKIVKSIVDETKKTSKKEKK